MFKPKEMKRTLIIGSKKELVPTIEILHALEVVHIIDFHPLETGEELQLGSPHEKASNMSQQLLKLRSSAQLLQIDMTTAKLPEKVPELQVKKDIDLKIQDIELSVVSLMEDKTRIETHLNKLDERIRQLLPFVAMNLPIESYHDYEHITVFTGYVSDIKKLQRDLPSITDEFELFSSNEHEQMIALFVSKKYADECSKLLVECRYSEVHIPEGTGLPSEFLEKWALQKKELQEKLDQTKNDLIEYRQRYAEYILASEEYLSIEVQKAEASVRFAETTHSFIIDCWIPTHHLDLVKRSFEQQFQDRVFIQEYDVKKDEEPPTLLENPKTMKKFEYLLDLYSLPNYRDIDPTFILSLIFPFFFGLMIGDAGFGILLILVGIIFIKKFADSEALVNVGTYSIYAGVFATIFGLFLFGDLFGISFQSLAGESGIQYSWSSLLGVSIPIPSVIHKMAAFGMTELLVLSIIAGTLHLGLGLLLGIISERKYHVKNAITKGGLLCILAALSLLIFVMADYTIGLWIHPLKTTFLGPFIWGNVIPTVKAGIFFGGLIIPYITILLGVIGIIIILLSAGGFGMIEVLEITGHLISYTRLAAICVAKGALAFAFNVIGIGLILSGNILLGIIGAIFIVIMQMIVLALGSLSAGIQALRLHYVEFFMKFYKGEGVKFTPFRYIRKYTTE